MECLQNNNLEYFAILF